MAASDPGRWGECGPRPPGRLGARGGQEPGTVLGAVGMMDLAYVCEWEKWAKSTYCPSLPLACAWSCRNLIAFTTDLRNDDQDLTHMIHILDTEHPWEVHSVSYQRHETEQFPAEPLELAKDYVCSQFPTPEAVLEGARYMVALQIAREPLVRQVLRQTFQERAKLNITPTKKGRKDVDEAHYAYSFKYLKNKPVKELRDDQFLKIGLAEDEGLLTIDISIDMKGVEGYGNDQTYFEEIKQFYYRDEFSHQVQEWNRQRTMAIERALQQFLYVQMAKELKNKLLAEARESVVKACSRKLYNWLRVAPYRPDQQVEEDDDFMDENQGQNPNATPAQWASSQYGYGGSGGGSSAYHVFPTPAQQPVATPLMTPSYSYTTPSQPITTPQYHQLQASTTPQSTQAQPQPSSSSRQRQQQPKSNSHAAIDWGKMAEQWLQEKEAERRKQKQRLTPRPSPSPMIESTPMSIAGDATPLLDEMDR